MKKEDNKMTKCHGGLCPNCRSEIKEKDLYPLPGINEIKCKNCGKKVFPIVATRLFNEILHAGLETIKNSKAVILVRGKKIELEPIREHYEISPKDISSTGLIKEGIIALSVTADNLNLDIKKKSDIELDPVLLFSIIACCYKDGAQTGEISFRKISDSEKGKEIKIFDHHSAGEGNRFIALGNVKIRKQQAFPGFPLKIFATIGKTPSVLLFFRYFSVLNDPAYDMRENEAIIFH